ILDVAVSLAKVADVDRTLGKEDVAVDGFQEGIKLLESLTLKSEEAGLEPRRLSVLAFLKSQLEEKQSEATASSLCPVPKKETIIVDVPVPEPETSEYLVNP
ncbi:hypothetical protein Goari_005160, partial [Gossypium aridum]|nr:hypothetical protein [Gossypium aridum]